MTNEELRKKYPEIFPIYESLCAERDAILAKVQPLEDEADALHAKAEAAMQVWREKRAAVVQWERGPRLRDVCNQIAALARSMRGHSLKAEGGSLGVKHQS